jgi:hypothetical protein
MSRFFACAGLGVFLTLAASILAIFAHVSPLEPEKVLFGPKLIDP